LKFKSSGEVEDVTGELKGTPRQPPPDPHGTSLFESEPKVPVPNLSKEKARTTIIFCDIPDSSLLLRKTSAARFHEWLAHCRREWSAAVERNGGVVFHSGRGNVEAYFLDSADHEDGAERAVAAALEISALTKSLSTHRVLKQARTRIGIATGVLSPYQLRPTAVLNRTCKLAAALSMTSRDDFIAVDDTTRKLIDGSFRMKDCGRNSIPLFRSPTRFWRILGHQN
jgi:class 3 adenylate cyclase